MIQLQRFIDELRARLTRESRILKQDTGFQILEFIDEAPIKQVEILAEKIVKSIDIDKIKKPPGDIYALDSSSRIVETPYLFIAIGAGSIHSRFTGRSIDVPHTASLLGLEEPYCRHITLIPEIEIDEATRSMINSAPGLLAQNPLGIPYSHLYDKHLLLAELRLDIETCLLDRFSSQMSPEGMAGTVVFIDGPLIYPSLYPVESEINQQERTRLASTSINHYNRRRSEIIRKLWSKGIVTIGVVKRLHRSFYLSGINPVGLKVGRISDEAYVSTMILTGKLSIDKPALIGPIRVKHDTLDVTRTMWYIVAPRRIYPVSSSMGNFIVYRVEVLGNEYDDRVVDYVLYDSLRMGSLLPLSILVVDKRVKKLTSSITNYILYTTGLSEEATSQYITII